MSDVCKSLLHRHGLNDATVGSPFQLCCRPHEHSSQALLVMSLWKECPAAVAAIGHSPEFRTDISMALLAASEMTNEKPTSE